MNPECVTTFKTTAWEDNNGALTLANMDPGQNTAQSKFYDSKAHWFRQHITRDGEDVAEGKRDGIYVRKIDTKLQKADIFTKCLPVEDRDRVHVNPYPL